MAQNTFHLFKCVFFFFYFEINQLNVLNIIFRLFYITLCRLSCMLFSPLTNTKRNKQTKKEEDEDKNKTKQQYFFFCFMIYLNIVLHALFEFYYTVNKSHRNHIHVHDIKVSFKLYTRNEIHQHWIQKTIIFSCDVTCYCCCKYFKKSTQEWNIDKIVNNTR